MMRTVKSAQMNGARLWLAAALLPALVAAAGGGKYLRRSLPTHQTLPVSKSGWRPVVGSGSPVFGASYNAAPLHASAYKYPVAVVDTYPSSARPLISRESNKLTSFAQSYRPTTLRTVPAAPASPPANQPINSYHNPFAYNNNLAYKYVQNFPTENVVIRNPQNPYAARPVFGKYPNKAKPLQNSVLQQLGNVQPIHFGQYQQTSKPIDVFGKPVETYARPADSKPAQSGMEIYKPEVYKLPDSAPAPQTVSQPVKTAQQQQLQQHQQYQQQFQQQQYLVGSTKTPLNPYAHYTYQDSIFPPGILGSFGSFGLQQVKGRDPAYQHTKTTYLAPQPTKQTVFNSYSYTPTFKTTPTIFGPTTTPKFQTTANQLQFTTLNDYKNYQNLLAQTTKLPPSIKEDPNANKDFFKASPQDPFAVNKHYQNNYNKLAVTTYNPLQQATLGNNYYSYNYNPAQQSAQVGYFDQPAQTFAYQNKKQKIHDSVTAGVNHVAGQYVSPPKSKPTYEVTETSEADPFATHSTAQAWTQQSSDSNPKTTEETVTKQLSPDTGAVKPTTTLVPELPEEYAIVTEADKGYENSLSYDTQVESQSRRPLGDDFEPIGKHKLKDYYYKVSTPTYESYVSSKRTKKPSESLKVTTQADVNTLNKDNVNEEITEALPTLPPNKHFKRPTTPEPLDKDRIRKRNKNRRRRPPLANINQNREEYSSITTEQPQTTDTNEVYTLRPRIRPTKGKPNLTTPSVTTDLTTSAVPTISPTAPTIIKKKLIRRPPTTLAERFETTTQSVGDFDNNKESPIMKIATRPQHSKYNSNYESNDYSHKQDEKDTPTSDVDVSVSESLKTATESKPFVFHKDVKPIEAKIEIRETTTDSTKDDNSEVTTVSSETTTNKLQRPRLKNKFNRPRFSVKDYRNRLSSTTSTTEKSTEATPKLRYRKVTISDSENETTTERKKFIPKDPRHKLGNGSELTEENEKEIHSIRHRHRQTTAENESTTQKISSRIRNGTRKPKPTEEVPETTTVHSKRPLRKKIKDSEVGESIQDTAVTETTLHYDKNDITSERTRSESAIMKIADKKHHQDPIEHLFEHSKRVSDLTLAASKDYNTPGMFKTVASSSRRIPSYFTIATDDPILPIEAFFPQLNQKKES